jgi:hypothetical protein
VNDLYDVTLRDTPDGVRLIWEIKAERKDWRELREGAYMLRTNLKADTAEQMWSQYMQLTEAEASFRAFEKRIVHSSFVPSKGVASEGSCDGGISGLRFVGDAEARAEAPAGHRSRTFPKRSEQR